MVLPMKRKHYSTKVHAQSSLSKKVDLIFNDPKEQPTLTFSSLKKMAKTRSQSNRPKTSRKSSQKSESESESWNSSKKQRKSISKPKVKVIIKKSDVEFLPVDTQKSPLVEVEILDVSNSFVQFTETSVVEEEESDQEEQVMNHIKPEIIINTIAPLITEFENALEAALESKIDDDVQQVGVEAIKIHISSVDVITPMKNDENTESIMFSEINEFEINSQEGEIIEFEVNSQEAEASGSERNEPTSQIEPCSEMIVENAESQIEPSEIITETFASQIEPCSEMIVETAESQIEPSEIITETFASQIEPCSEMIIETTTSQIEPSEINKQNSNGFHGMQYETSTITTLEKVSGNKGGDADEWRDLINQEIGTEIDVQDQEIVWLNEESKIVGVKAVDEVDLDKEIQDAFKLIADEE